jgi:hypothetical protein
MSTGLTHPELGLGDKGAQRFADIGVIPRLTVNDCRSRRAVGLARRLCQESLAPVSEPVIGAVHMTQSDGPKARSPEPSPHTSAFDTLAAAISPGQRKWRPHGAAEGDGQGSQTGAHPTPGAPYVPCLWAAPGG